MVLGVIILICNLVYTENYHGTRGTQVNYYDEIRYAKNKCSKLKLEELGYKKLLNLKIKKLILIDTTDFKKKTP